MLMSNLFFDLLPDYFKENDSYKDIDDRGLLERYLSIYGEELEEFVYPVISSYLDIVDPKRTRDVANNIIEPLNSDDNKFLTDIGYTLGNPLYLQDDELYRKILSFVIYLYKIKGTIPAYKAWANLLGLTIAIIELEDIEVTYDSGYYYDSDIIDQYSSSRLTYDTNCNPCSYYIVEVVGVKESDLSDTTKTLLKNIIDFNQPIDAKLQTILYSTIHEEEIFACMEETITLTFSTGGGYDSGNTYDSGLEYDNTFTSTTVVVEQTCNLPGGEFDLTEFDLSEFKV